MREITFLLILLVITSTVVKNMADKVTGDDPTYIHVKLALDNETVKTFGLGITVEEKGHVLYNLGWINRMTIVCFLVTIFFFGTTFRILVFRMINKIGSLTKTPISIMILIDEISKMTGCTLAIPSFIIGILMGNPVVEYFGSWFCEAMFVSMIYSAFAAVTGGAGIALMRLLYIKNATAIANGASYKYTLSTILVISYRTALTLTGLWVSAPQPTVTLQSFCHGKPTIMMQVLYDITYTQSHSWMTLTIPKLTIGLFFIFCSSEIYMYWSIYQHLSQHDKTMQGLLSNEVLKKRRKKNVIQLTGHFSHFVLEMAAICIAGLSTINTRDTSRMMAVFTVFAVYGLNGMTQICLSATLREEFSNVFLSNVVSRYIFVLPFERAKRHYQRYRRRHIQN